MNRTIVLLTDFGLKDPFVGQMKGVVRSLAPDAAILDLCHEVHPHSVIHAAFLLQCSFRHFPVNSIFICVVDPGVGGERLIIAAEYGGMIFLAPDNGLLSFLPQDTFWWQLRLPVSAVSKTFHGRDIFAPLAARLACGVLLVDLGMPLAHTHICSLNATSASIQADSIICQVVHVDRFGNCLLNLADNMADQLGEFWRAGSEQLIRRVKTYAEIGPHEIGILAGSQGVMELAKNQCSCAAYLNIQPGQTLTLHCMEP